MKGCHTVALESRPGELRAAALDAQGEVLQFAVERSHLPNLLGAAYVGRVRAVRPEIGAAFVDIGTAADGFLNLKKNRATDAFGTKIEEGAAIAVTLTRMAEAGKGPKLSLSLPEDAGTLAAAPSLIRPGPALAVRVLADWVGPETGRVLVDDADLYREIDAGCDALEMVPAGGRAFDALGIAETFQAQLSPSVALPGGGTLVIHETPAMATIDVNAGTSVAGSAERQALETNLEAVAEIARALRLRVIGGLIAVDFLRMQKKENQVLVMKALHAALAADPMTPKAAGFSAFGLVEIVRRREGPSLAETYLRRSLEPTSETRALDLLDILARRRGSSASVRVSPEILAALTGPLAEARRRVEARLGFDIALSELSDAGSVGYEIKEP